MGLQLIEFAAWARNRKILATLLVTVTLAIGIVIGPWLPDVVGASHPASTSDAIRWPIPDPVQLSSAFGFHCDQSAARGCQYFDDPGD